MMEGETNDYDDVKDFGFCSFLNTVDYWCGTINRYASAFSTFISFIPFEWGLNKSKMISYLYVSTPGFSHLVQYSA